MELWLGAGLAAILVGTTLWFALRQHRARQRSEIEFPDDVPELLSSRAPSPVKSSKSIHDDRHEGDASNGGDASSGGDGGGGGGD